MMRWTGGIATGLAVLFLGPALISPARTGLAAPRRDDPESKRRAIAEVDEIAATLRNGSREAVARLVGATEAPILDTGGRDARIENLRGEVDELQRRLDLARTRQANAGAGANPSAYTEPRSEHGVAATSTAPNTSTSGATRSRAPGAAASKGRTTEAPPRSSASRAPAQPNVAASKPRAAEEDGYSADPLRQAIACIRAAQHARGLALLDRVASNGTSEYWRGKAYAGLGKHELALASYTKAATLAPKSVEGRLAKTEVDFLGWKLGLTKPGATAQTDAPATGDAKASDATSADAKAGSHPK